MAYGINKNLSPRKRVISMFESWNMNGFRDTSSNKNSNKTNLNDPPFPGPSHLERRQNEIGLKNSTRILPSRPFPQMPIKLRPSTCVCINTIRSSSSLPNRPSTANNCTRYHDNMLQALMRNVDKFCGNKPDNKEATNVNSKSAISHNVVQNERKKKAFESKTTIAIDDFVKQQDKTKDNNTTPNKKNAKASNGKRKKTKAKNQKTGSNNDAIKEESSKTSLKIQKDVTVSDNSQTKNRKSKDAFCDEIDTAWEISDFEQLRNLAALVMPKETKHATLSLLHEKKLKADKKLNSQSVFFDNVSTGFRKPKTSIKSLNVNKNDLQTLNVCPYNLLCDGQDCNHRMRTTKINSFPQAHLHKNVIS